MSIFKKKHEHKFNSILFGGVLIREFCECGAFRNNSVLDGKTISVKFRLKPEPVIFEMPSDRSFFINYCDENIIRPEIIEIKITDKTTLPKVYCENCKWFKTLAFWDKNSPDLIRIPSTTCGDCIYLNNIKTTDTPFRQEKRPAKTYTELNANNNCSWYEPKPSQKNTKKRPIKTKKFIRSKI